MISIKVSLFVLAVGYLALALASVPDDDFEFKPKDSGESLLLKSRVTRDLLPAKQALAQGRAMSQGASNKGRGMGKSSKGKGRSSGSKKGRGLSKKGRGVSKKGRSTKKSGRKAGL